MPRVQLVLDIDSLTADELGLTKLDHALRAVDARLSHAFLVPAPEDDIGTSPSRSILSALGGHVVQRDPVAPAPSKRPELRRSPMPATKDDDGPASSLSALSRIRKTEIQKSPDAFDRVIAAANDEERIILEFVSAGAPVSGRIIHASYPQIPMSRLAQRIAKLAKNSHLVQAMGAYVSPSAHRNVSIARLEISEGGGASFAGQRRHLPDVEGVLASVLAQDEATDDATISAFCIAPVDEVRAFADTWVKNGRIRALDIAHGRRLYASTDEILQRDPRAPRTELSADAQALLNVLPEGPVFLDNVLWALEGSGANRAICAGSAISELEVRGLIRFLDIGRKSVLTATSLGLAHASRDPSARRAISVFASLPEDVEDLPLAYICGNDLLSKQRLGDQRRIVWNAYETIGDAEQQWLIRSGKRLGLIKVTSDGCFATDALLKLWHMGYGNRISLGDRHLIQPIFPYRA